MIGNTNTLFHIWYVCIYIHNIYVCVYICTYIYLPFQATRRNSVQNLIPPPPPPPPPRIWTSHSQMFKKKGINFRPPPPDIEFTLLFFAVHRLLSRRIQESLHLPTWLNHITFRLLDVIILVYNFTRKCPLFGPVDVPLLCIWHLKMTFLHLWRKHCTNKLCGHTLIVAEKHISLQKIMKLQLCDAEWH